MRPISVRIAAFLVVVCVSAATVPAGRAETKTLARCGAGFLEEVDGYRVLHVKGDPYEMGYQQGALLRDDIREGFRFLFEVKAKELKFELGGLKLLDPKKVIKGIASGQRKFVPERFFDEMRGIADGAGLDVQDVVIANFIPELFHCSGFALSGSATKDGTLYHGRVLDYGCDWRLQEHAVLTVAEPRGKIPFVNVTYAGFVGSVTGMNAERVSIGEMGGRGMGHWEGVPMAFLVRMVLEEADTLDRGIAIFRDHPRTCEYYFVIADGKTGKAVGMEACWNVFGVIGMGESHPRLPHAIKDAVVLSAGDRYTELVKRVEKGLGGFDAESARHLMDRPVAMKSNLHSVLFETTTTRFWVANASINGKPAAEQPYHAFQLSEILKHQADPSATVLPAPSRASSPVGQCGAVSSIEAVRWRDRELFCKNHSSRVVGENTVMRTLLTAATLVAVWGFGTPAVVAQARKIDLQTKAGVTAVKGQWRYHDVKIVEVEGKGPDGRPNKTYNIEPRALGADFDDSKWEVIAPESLQHPRSNGQVCFCWYRTKITIPPDAGGKKVFFQTTVDDYGEIWVDGKLPRTPGKGGEAVVAGFNAANRVELKDPQPGKVYQIAVFAINGPISAAPSNWLFLKNTALDIEEKASK